MRSHHHLRLGVSFAMLLACVGAAPVQAAVPAKTSLEESVAQAKQSGRPLIVFGLSDTCSRCQAVKTGVANTPEFKLLMTQYVATEIPFGGREFATMFRDIISRDKSIPPSIGAPSVFIFTSKGDTVYAGPNRESGIAMDDEFKKLLISGIEKNGGLRTAGAASNASLSSDVAKARRMISQNQPAAAAALVAKHLSPEGASDDELIALTELTGLQVAKSKSDEQLDAVVEQLSQKAQPLIQAAIALGKAKPTVGAVRLAELSQTFAAIPSVAPALDDAWQKLEQASSIPELRQQAQLIAEARQAESKGRPAALAAYQTVIATYPNTEAAKLCQLRIAQLQSGKGDATAAAGK